MSSFLKGSAITVGIVLFLWLMIVLAHETEKLNFNKIQNWSTEHGYSVTSIERCYFDIGPFWFVDSDSENVYKAELIEKSTDDHKISYFVIGPFNMRQAWK